MLKVTQYTMGVLERMVICLKALAPDYLLNAPVTDGSVLGTAKPNSH